MRQKIRSVGTSSNSYGGFVITYLRSKHGRMKLVVGGRGAKMERRQHQAVRGADLTVSDLRYRFVHELGTLR